MIISIMNPKGGVSKSTICLFLANYLHHTKKKKVLVIDSDKQGSLVGMLDEQVGEHYTVDEFRSSSASKWKAYLESKRQKYDYILIDTAGSYGTGERHYLIQQSGCIIVPVVAQQMTLETTAEFAQDLEVIIEGTDTKLLAIAAMARNTKEQTQIGIVEQVGLKLVGALPYRVRYSRHRSMTKPLKDEDLIKLMQRIYKHIKL